MILLPYLQGSQMSWILDDELGIQFIIFYCPGVIV
jgi:hypothetical protein